jgi:Domain of unknown function (DUF4189)
MKTPSLFALLLAGLAVGAIQRVNAGSAVAYDFRGHAVYSFGHPKAVEIHRAMDLARRHGWADARIIAASDVPGYGAIAVARKGRGSVLGAALGRPSREDAERRAIEICLKGGGTDPKVRWEFNG